MAKPSRQRSPQEVEGSASTSWEAVQRRMAARRERQDEPPEVPEQTMDEFLREMHQTTTLGDNGDTGTPDTSDSDKPKMPSLAELKRTFKTKSAVIRHLHTEGFQVKDIAKHLGLRYQHVRNVLTTELKRGPNENFRIDSYAAPGVQCEPEE